MPNLDETLQQLLTLPREAGTAAASRARALVTAHLEALGYQVNVQRFTFPPASLMAFPLFGAGLGWLALVLTPLFVMPRAPAWLALTLWSVGLTALALLALAAGLGWATVGAGRELREDANLVATRGDGPIRRWIVAHLDTKAQGHSMAGRLVAVWIVAMAVAALTALAAARVWGPIPLGPAAGGAALALVAGALAGRGRLRGTSVGARDNGSGVAAALIAAETTTDPAVGILITGAEEFGLVGARVFAQVASDRLRGVEIVNLDTIDEEGALALVSHDAAGTALARRLAPSLAAIGPPVRLRRLPLGIFVDSAPLARAGAQAVTIGRLTWRTLRRLHTPADTPDGLSLETARSIGRRIAAN